MKLVIEEPGNKSREIELVEPTTEIGRHEEGHIVLHDPRSSRRHCRIHKTDGGYELEDLGSRNGTLLNGKRVDRQLLSPGDRIEIGKSKIYFGGRPEPRESVEQTVFDDAVSQQPVVTPEIVP